MKKLLSSSDKTIRKGNAFYGSILASVIMTAVCLVCFTGVTWAWFTANTAVKTAEIVTANFEAEISVSDENGNEVQLTDGEYVFDSGKTYQVKITGYGTASTGFAVFEVEGVEYHTDQLNPKDENSNSVTFNVRGYSPLKFISSNWGTSSFNDPVFDGDPRFIKNSVKLVPLNSDSTAVIERDGIVETWHEFGDVLPYGISADNIKEPDDTAYDSEGFDRWFVYGLKENMTEADFADFVKVTGDGTMKIIPTEAGYGTGTVIEVYDGNVLVEQFFVIIFGDMDGNGIIDINDSALLRTESVEGTWSVANKVYYLIKAANLDLNDYIDIDDSALERTAIVGDIGIDQTTGKAS